MKRTMTGLTALVLVVAGVARTPAVAAISWTGAGTNNTWADGDNWSNGSGPGAAETAYFDNDGASTIPGELTNVLTTDRTIGGLAFSNNGRYHTADLGGHTLSVGGNLDFNVNQSGHTSTVIRHGVLEVVGPYSNVNVGRSYSGGGWAIVNMEGLAEFRAEAIEFHVATRVNGSAFGELTLAESNLIDATEIVIGYNGTANVTLGQSNTVVAPNVLIGGSYSNSLVDIRSGGTLDLGTAVRRASLIVGKGIINTNSTYTGTLDLSGATLNAFLDHLTVGEKSDNPGNQKAYFIGGDGGAVSIGDAGNTSNVIVGHRATGVVDFAAMDSLTANLDQMIIGRSGSGSVALPAVNTIDARTIVVGEHGSSSLSLGLENTILVDQFDVGGSYGNAVVEIRSGGALNLGSAERRTSLTIGKGIINTNSTYTGTFDVSTATLNAFLDHLTVGQKADNPGNQKGYFYGGDGGSISVGEAGNTSNMIVADRASAAVDFGAMDSFTANLDQMIIGRGGSGTVTLADTNTIDARRIAVGDSSSTSTLSLGFDNTILVDQFEIGNSHCRGIVEIRSGGSLRLGTPERPANLTIGKGYTNTNSTYYGVMDLTNATFIAHLDHVIVGEKDVDPGGQRGTLTISHHAENDVHANSIVIGGTKSTGTLNFAGGSLTAGSIEKGPGTAYFNFTGGTLHVDTFGAPERSFHLANQGTGTLAPGSSAGSTQIHGNYNQGAFATAQIELAGKTPGTGHDQVNVSATATLAGTLDIDLIEPYMPDLDDAFDIATYAARSGKFDFVDPPSLPADRAFLLDYDTDPTRLTLRFVDPQLQTFTSDAASADWSDPAHWDVQQAPETNSAINLVNSSESPRQVVVGGFSTVHRIDASGTAQMSIVVQPEVKLAVSNDVTLGTNARVDLQDAALLARFVELSGGQLTGQGTIISELVSNGGLVSPQGLAGTVEVDGDYRQTDYGTLQIEIGSITEFDRLLVSDEATLAGTLSVEFFCEEAAAEFSILRYGGLAGKFDEVLIEGLSPDLFRIDYGSGTDDEVTMTIIPEPSTLLLMSIGAIGFLALARRRCRRR